MASSSSFRSSSVSSDFFFMALNFSMASRRMLRMATLPPSPYFFTCLVSSFRRSSVSWGKIRRITLPSFWGLMPSSEASRAFSTALSRVPSQGWITRVRASGVEMEATCWMGVSVP